MSTLLLVIFGVELLAHLISAIGAAQINKALWTLLNHLPVATSRAAGAQRKLQTEYLGVRRELNATSSQDEFAKWAKLRRQHDKLLDQLDAAKKEMEASRSSFDRYLTAARLLLTKVPQYVLPFWYGKEPMFWLPYGWFPYYAEWIISFPRAPLGSVSAPSWQLACSGFIALVSQMLAFLWVAATGGGRATEQAKTTEQAKAPRNSAHKTAMAAAAKKDL